MQNLAASPEHDDLNDRMNALDIDLSCALRFSRVALQALASVSDKARQAIDNGLAEEIAMVRIEGMAGSAAVVAILTEARHHLASATDDQNDAACRDLELLLVERAADLTRGSPAPVCLLHAIGPDEA